MKTSAIIVTKPARWLMSCAIATTFLPTGMYGQQPPTFSGIVQKVGGNEVGHAQVHVEGAGEYQTTDHGEFTFSSNSLKIGGPIVFHVKDWVITRPCELQNGRAYLHDPGEGDIQIFVLPPRDPRLKSVQAIGSIIGCLILDEASQFPRKPKPLEGLAGRCQASSIQGSRSRSRIKALWRN